METKMEKMDGVREFLRYFTAFALLAEPLQNGRHRASTVPTEASLRAQSIMAQRQMKAERAAWDTRDAELALAAPRADRWQGLRRYHYVEV